MGHMNDSAVLAHLQSVLQQESQAIAELIPLAAQQESKIQSVIKQIVEQCGGTSNGRLILSGVGKAGIIAHKLSATFASTGTPSIFMHPTEARHGDLGMVQEQDLVLALSNSGASEELISILPAIKRIGAQLIALCGNEQSELAQHADTVISIGSISEACPLGLAPSCSTTAMLAMGDAIALTVQNMRSFSSEDYARYHPGGALGRKLMTCAEAMRDRERVATVSTETSVQNALKAITQKRAGSAIIIDEQDHILGIFTDGDLRRALSDSDDATTCLSEALASHATIPCRSVKGSELLQSAIHLCSEYKINELPVSNANGQLIGMLDLQDLADRGFSL